MTNQTDLQFIHHFYECWEKSWHLIHMHEGLEQEKPQAQGQSSHPPASPALRMCSRILLFVYKRLYRGVWNTSWVTKGKLGGILQRLSAWCELVHPGEKASCWLTRAFHSGDRSTLLKCPSPLLHPNTFSSPALCFSPLWCVCVRVWWFLKSHINENSGFRNQGRGL